MPIETIAALRVQLAVLSRAASPAAPHLPFGLPALDGCLPGGGLALGAVHEVFAGGPAIEHATGRRWALPFPTVLAPSERWSTERGRRHKTVVDWAKLAKVPPA